MTNQILFIQGGGDNGFEADTALVASLQQALGKEYKINYPKLQSDESASDFGWIQLIGEKIDETNGDILLVGHSFGASMILKYLSESPANKRIKGVFLVATPFWDGQEDWQTALQLREDFADKLPEVPIFFYHCRDDEEIPFTHLQHYKRKVTSATFRELKSGGHQFNNDLTLVAIDIKSIK